jgi:hypothetical protein
MLELIAGYEAIRRELNNDLFVVAGNDNDGGVNAMRLAVIEQCVLQLFHAQGDTVDLHDIYLSKIK